MFRTSLLALAATVGLAGATEFGTNQAQADTIIRVGIGGHSHDYYRRPVYPAPVVYYPAPVSYYASPVVVTTPVIATPAICGYEVFYRDCPTAPWRLYGSYGSHYRAHEIEASLRVQGFRAYVEHR